MQIVLPQDDLFADEASPATAAIMLGNSADTLQPGAVRGMAQLAASAVKGLKSRERDDHRLHRRGPVAVRRGRRHRRRQLSKAGAEARYARQKESAINAMLASTLGPGKAQVKVNADLNMDETTREGADRTAPRARR